MSVLRNVKRDSRASSAGWLLFVLLCGFAEPTLAQIDLTGTWTTIIDEDAVSRGPGPDLVDYLGVPLNDQARAAALSYTPENVDELDRQCDPWPVHYIVAGPHEFRITPTIDLVTDELVAWNVTAAADRAPMTIWMNGHGPGVNAQAQNTPAGYTVGRWAGDTLITTTTHIQDGYLTRNGVPSSDRETFTMFVTRYDNLLTITGIVEDPVYLTAPYVLAGSWYLDVVNQANSRSTCTPEEEVDSLANDHVPSYLRPQENPTLMNLTQTYHIPHEAALGGEQTMYPQYTKRLKQYTPPVGYCRSTCCSAVSGDAVLYDTRVLKCDIGGR